MTPTSQKILFVITSTRDAGSLTSGYWYEEMATPFYELSDAGWQVDFASPQGGEPPCDPMSREDAWMTDGTRRFDKDSAARAALAASAPLALVRADGYDAVFLVGGIATMWDFPDNADLARIVETVDRAGGTVASVCHGAAGLIPARKADGTALVAGRRIVSWTDAEKAALGLTDKVPFLLESRLRDLGAAFDGGDNFADVVRIDGNLVTGQNPMSSAATARAILATRAAQLAAE